MDTIEKSGQFYIGKVVNPSDGKLSNEPLLYDSKNLTTHAVCVGMTGSGKTGLGITLLEEGALDKIPAIIVDPKGDLSNLLLTFPNLSPEEFKPWVDAAEAERKGMTVEGYAEYISNVWKNGLEAWGEGTERIKKLRNTVDFVVYTPASRAGIPISILRSFSAPPKEQQLDATAMRDRVLSITSSILGLLGIEADPVKSREHILIATIIQQAWENGKDLDIATLIQQIQNPPFLRIGALDIDTFYPPKDRVNLSIMINNFLASPSFKYWMEGEPLDIQNMLYSTSGKPRLAIISIAHLADAERMFFVTLLLNEIITWMRMQSGTSHLRALFYMDEIFGYFPPIAAPPSKLPMLTILKQARAFGLGVILATQNPVDLDYKGLSNCGTWFIGKLQTERDKARVLDGLKLASIGELDTKDLAAMIAMTGNRMFILRSIYEKKPILFQTRWSLSYLRGPLTLNQIEKLMNSSEKTEKEKAIELQNIEKVSLSTGKPNVPPDISESFVVTPELLGESGALIHYEPKVLGLAKLHYVDTKKQIDLWQDVCLLSEVDDHGKSIDWNASNSIPGLKNQLSKECIPGSTFAELPSGLLQQKNYTLFSKNLAASLYQNQTLTLYQTIDPPMISKGGESEKDFRFRVAQEMRNKREDLIIKVQEKYKSKIAILKEKIQRTQEKIQERKQKKGFRIVETIISFLSTVASIFLGRKVTKGAITQTGTSLRRATQIGKDSYSENQTEEVLRDYQEQLQDIERQRNNEISDLQSIQDGGNLIVQPLILRPKKSDITIEKVMLVWCPKNFLIS